MSLSLLSKIENDILGGWHHVESKLDELRHEAGDLVDKYASAFEVALAAAVKRELSIITKELFSKLKTLAAAAAALAAQQATAVMTGQETKAAAMGHFVSGVEAMGLNSKALSAWSKDSLLQAGGEVMKMVGAAAFATANPTESPSAPSANSAAQH